MRPLGQKCLEIIHGSRTENTPELFRQMIYYDTWSLFEDVIALSNHQSSMRRQVATPTDCIVGLEESSECLAILRDSYCQTQEL